MSTLPNHPHPQMLKIHDDLCDALARSKGPGAAEHLDPESLRALHESVEAAMRPLIRAMGAHPSLMRQALKSPSPEAITMLLEAHGVETYQRMHRQRRFTLNEPIRRGNVAQLEALAQAGFDLASYAPALARQVYRRDDPDFVSFAREILGPGRWLLEALSPLQLIQHCPASLVEETARQLRSALKDPDDPFLMKAGREDLEKHPKLLAVILFAEERARGFIRPVRGKSCLPSIETLLDLTGSSHGRLKLFSMEPSLEDVLARPPEDPVFGLQASTDRKHPFR